MDNQQPTKEELEATLKKTQEELDKPEEVVEEETISEAEPVVSEPVEEASEEEVTEENQEPEEEVSEEQTLREKTQRATKEAEKLNADKKKINEALHEAYNVPDPTEEELKAEYPEWELMDANFKKLAKDNLVNKRKLGIIDKANEETRNIQEWNFKVEEYVDDPKTLNHHPELEGKEQEFIAYATDKTRRNINLSLIVSAFIHDVVDAKPVPKKGKMFETPSGGPNDNPAPKGDKITTEEAAVLMKTDYKKYKEMLIAGKIESPVV